MILLAPGVRAVPAARRARRLAIAARRRASCCWRSRCAARRRVAVRVEPADALARCPHAAATACVDALQHVLVRRHQVRLARHDGDERAAVDARATTRRCTGSTCGSSSASAGAAARGRRPGAARATRPRAAPSCCSRSTSSTLVFAFSYNVGDAHVFYLPSHLIVALLAAPGVALAGRLDAATHAPLAAVARSSLYAGARALSRLSGARSQRRRPAADGPRARSPPASTIGTRCC